jgi:hypothetical protein
MSTTVRFSSTHEKTWKSAWCSYITTSAALASKCILDAMETNQRQNVSSPPPLVFFPAKENVMELQEDIATSEALNYGNENDAIEMLSQNKAAETEEARTRQEDLLYDNLPETLPIAVDNGQITFCCPFKYLGLWISYNLCNDFDVNKPLTSATQSMGALKTVWNCPHLDIFSKYLLFRTIPMYLLLWGCKTWSIHQALLDKLEVFLHRSIQQILHVSMTCVKEERIRNEHMRRMFYNIPCVQNMIAMRQLDFIGKAIRGAPNRSARSLIAACCAHKRLVGCPFLHNKDAIVKNLCLLSANVPEVIIDDTGSLKSWIQEDLHEAYWNQLVQSLLHCKEELPAHPTEWPRP